MPPAETTEDIARVGLWGWRFVNFDIAATACERGNLWFRENSFTVGILLISVAHAVSNSWFGHCARALAGQKEAADSGGQKACAGRSNDTS
eukprot:3762176-Rhodomonas_salina.2